MEKSIIAVTFDGCQIQFLSNASYFCFPNSTALVMRSSLTAQSLLFLSDVLLKMSLSLNFKIYAIENEVYSVFSKRNIKML